MAFSSVLDSEWLVAGGVVRPLSGDPVADFSAPSRLRKGFGNGSEVGRGGADFIKTAGRSGLRPIKTVGRHGSDFKNCE